MVNAWMDNENEEQQHIAHCPHCDKIVPEKQECIVVTMGYLENDNTTLYLNEILATKVYHVSCFTGMAGKDKTPGLNKLAEKKEKERRAKLQEQTLGDMVEDATDQCLLEDTKVMTDKGFLPVKELTGGDYESI